MRSGTYMLEQLGGRKLIASLLILIVGIVTVVVRGDIPENFLTLLEFVFGGYSLSNVASKVVYATSNKVAATAPEPEPVPPPKAEPTQQPVPAPVDHTQILNNISNGVVTVQQILEFIVKKTGLDK